MRRKNNPFKCKIKIHFFVQNCDFKCRFLYRDVLETVLQLSRDLMLGILNRIAPALSFYCIFMKRPQRNLWPATTRHNSFVFQKLVFLREIKKDIQRIKGGCHETELN